MKSKGYHVIQGNKTTMSCQTTLIYQKKPPLSKPSMFTAKSWTDTVEGYVNEARKLTTCIRHNRKLMGRPYTWLVTIYIWPLLSPAEITALWTAACRKLRAKGIVALWVREPTKSNKCHYHLLVSSPIDKSSLIAAIEQALPQRKTIGWHKRVQQVDDEWWLARYLTKAKVSCRVNGVHVEDKYARKRLLFQPGLNMKKYGTIGKFWVTSKKAIWQTVRDREQRIAAGLADWRIKRLASHAHQLVLGYVPLRTIERSFGYYAKSPHIQSWAERLYGLTINSDHVTIVTGDKNE